MKRYNFLHFLFVLFVVALFSLPFASASQSTQVGEKIKVKVEGMVCDSCSADLTKAFKENIETQDISVDLKSQLLTITVSDKSKITDSQISKVVTERGYKLISISRD